ncbi:MAG: prolipoprotein diacylglyceryl transferase [Acidobacteria bacterium]|nr:prolipoprotein diacylglyceryl transferase [Acidobacteriota bacterium]
MFPKLFSIDGFFLPTYGLLVTAGFLVGLWVAGRLAKRDGMNPQLVTDLGIYVALAGLAGAKLLMLLYDANYYLSHPGDIFSMATLQAGGVFHGGLIAALAVAIWYVKQKKLAFLPVADVFAPGIAIGHAIGRIGCFAAGCCWGIACDRPWAVKFTDVEAYKLVGVPLEKPLHPTQLYEAFAEAVIFSILYWRIGKAHGRGTIIALYLMLYPAARFVVEFFRAHEQANPFGGPLSIAQWVALGLVGAGAVLFVVSSRQRA